jgi:hypothetical protein
MAEDLQKEEQAPEVVVLPGNCAGELEALPAVEGVTHTAYKCKVCGQVVYVGHEDLEANGLPTQHARLEEDK